MTTTVETLIVGAGQAGLALSRCLTDRAHEHVLLERGRVAERWRSERWDSFTLLTPSWQTRLPGHRYDGPEPHGFLDREAVVAMFDRYAASFAAPVEHGVSVTRVARQDGRWAVTTDRGRYAARNVVIATGDQQTPRIPRVAAALPRDLVQLHASRYRNPAQLPPGAVLVVGAGPSGQQIADELVRAGRRVLLAVGRHRWLPRRVAGRDVAEWMDAMGTDRRTLADVPDPAEARRRPFPVLSGRHAVLSVRTLAAAGVTPLGRLLAVDGGVARFGGDLLADVATADAAEVRFRARVAAFARAEGLPTVPDEEPAAARTRLAEPPPQVDLRAVGVTAVVWATGFRRTYPWLAAPVLDAEGEPVHHRGITAVPGLAFLGLRWQHTASSHAIDGVGPDAVHLAACLTAGSSRWTPAGWAAPALI